MRRSRVARGWRPWPRPEPRSGGEQRLARTAPAPAWAPGADRAPAGAAAQAADRGEEAPPRWLPPERSPAGVPTARFVLSSRRPFAGVLPGGIRRENGGPLTLD